mgnify:CR=1 FL=1
MTDSVSEFLVDVHLSPQGVTAHKSKQLTDDESCPQFSRPTFHWACSDIGLLFNHVLSETSRSKKYNCKRMTNEINNVACVNHRLEALILDVVSTLVFGASRCSCPGPPEACRTPG